MPRSRAPSRNSRSSSQLVNGTIGDRSSAGRGALRIPGFEPVPALGEGEAAQIFRPLAQNVVEPHRRREIAQHFRGRGLAVEPLLQVVERGDLAVADHQQLAVERHIRRASPRRCRETRRRYRRRSANRAAFRRRGRRAARGCRPISIRRDSRAGRARRCRASSSGCASISGQKVGRSPISGGGRPALEPIEQRLVGRREPVPDLLDAIDLDAAPLGERGLGEARRDADPQTRR